MSVNQKKFTGIIISVHKTGYSVAIDDSHHFCIINNSYKGESKPVVNDTVYLEKKEDRFIICDIVTRHNLIGRYDAYKEQYQGFAANVDTAFIVTSANREFSLNRIERFITLVKEQDVRTVIVLTKIDLEPNTKDYEQKLADKFQEVERVLIDSNNKEDVKKLLNYIAPKSTALMLGSSGVGKTTIINTLCGLSLKTREVQGVQHSNKGRHTTSARSIHFLSDGRKIIDNPGVRIIGIEGDDVSQRNSRNHRIKRTY